MNRRVAIGITGASGTVYAERLVEQLLAKVDRIYLVISGAGQQVMQHELAADMPEGRFSLRRAVDGEMSAEEKRIIRLCGVDDLFSPVASGSSAPTDMVILPCSMGTLGRIATGVSSNLLERAADVVLKQKRRLVVCPREMPFNTIHLSNMHTLAVAGAAICPPIPAFYQKPKSIDDMVDFVVGRVLELLELDHDLYAPWNSRMR